MFCLDMPKFGGKGERKQCCLQRICNKLKNCILKDIKERLTTALSILPKISVPAQTPISEQSTQHYHSQGSPLATCSESPELTVRKVHLFQL